MDTATVTKPRRRCHWTPEERAEWVALFEASGHSLSQFCRENDLPVPTLSAWRTQVQSRAVAEDETDAFLEVPATTLRAAAMPAAADTSAPPLQLHAGTVTLSLPADTDPAWLAALVRSLQG